jgi:flagella basal body P-ring formation protein FlgA
MSAITAARPRAGTASSAGAPAQPSSTAASVRGGRRNGKRVALGLLLVVATVAAFWQLDLRRHASESFLAIARPVAAGQALVDSDVKVVRIANTSGLDLLPADRRSEVVGRAAAVPLAAGSLLTAGQLGPSAWPAAGQAVIAVAVKPGRASATLAAGARVVVLVSTATATSTATGNPGGAADQPDASRRAEATVVAVTAGADQSGTQLVTLLLDANQAELVAVAAATGEVSLVQLGSARG